MALTTDLYTGSFKRRNTFAPAPYPLHTADPAHEQGGVFEGENAYTYTAPPTALPFDGDESWGSGVVVVDYSRPFDVTPNDTAYGEFAEVQRTDGIDLGIPGGSQDESQEDSYRIHSENLGATVQQDYGVPSLEFLGERYSSIRTEGLSSAHAEAIPPLAGGGQRGLNSLAVNNPPLEMYDGEGYRRGYTDWWRVSRKFNARIIQRHDLRPVFDNTAYGPTEQAAIGTPDSSPFSLLAKSITNTIQKPQLRRSPDLPDSTVTYEGEMAEESVIGAGGW
jgi:hypothetical protein